MTANGSFNAQGTINTDGDYIDASLRLSPRCDRHIRGCTTTIISDGETIRFFGDFSGSTLSSDMVGSFPKPPDDDEASCFGRPASGKLTIIDELKAWIWDAKWNGQGPVFMVKDIRLDLLLNGVEGCIQIHDADHYRPRTPEFDKPPLRLRDYIRPKISHEYNGVTLVERFDCSLEIWNGDTLMKVYEHAHPSTHMMLRRRNDLSRKAEEIMQTSIQNFRDDHTSSVVTIDPTASISASDQPKSLPRGFGRGKFMAEGNPSVILCPRCVSGLKDAYFELDLSLENLCDGCSLDHYLWQLDLPPVEGVQHQFVAEAAEMVMLSNVETFYYPDNRDGLESYGTWRQSVMDGSDPYITFPENTLQFLKTGCEITRISYSLGKTVDPSLRSKVIRDFVSEPFFKYVVLNKEICAAWPIVRITREFISGKCQEFIAESNEEIGSGLLQKIIEGIRGVSGTTFADVIEKILKIFTGYFSSLISVMSETINSFWNDAIGVLRTWFVRFFDPLKMIQKAVLGGEGFANYVMFFGIIITLFVSIFGLLSGGLAAKILLGYIGNRLSPFLKDQLSTMLSRDIPLEKRYVGEANPALAAVTVGIVGTVIGNTTKADNKKLNDFCRNFISLVSFGTVVTGSITALFLMLPGAFQRAVIYRYGTSEQKAKLEYEQWRNQAEALMKIHQIPSVLTSGRFREVLDKVLKDAHLIEKGFGSDNTRRLLFVAQLGRLQAINSNLTQYERMHGSRAVPFSIHLYGKPGAGKSTIAPKMAMEVTGHYGKENIYTKSMDEFWTGYIAEKIVLIDEFLATNDSERRTQQAKDYLGLISSQQFIPDMPSISNVTQGIKGTSVAPDMVITMNNTAYDVVTNLADPMALQRRRNFVVEIVVDPNAKKLPHSKYNVDVKAYTEDERQAFSWLKFVVRPGESSGGKQTIGTFDYPGLIAFLRNQYNEMREANDMIAQMTGTEGRAEIDVNRLIDQTLMEFEGIPTENISLLSIVWRSLKGEGGKRTRMKKRQMDPFKNRIKPEDFADHQRPICGLIYSDSRLTNADVAFLANLKGPFLDESYEKILRLKEHGSSNYETASEPDELGLGYCSADDPERHLVDLGEIHGRNHVANLDPTPPLKLMEHPNPQPMINEKEVIYNEDSRHNMYYQFPGESTEQFHERMSIYLNSALKSYVIEDKRQYLEGILSKLDTMVLSPGEKSQLYESYEVLRAADPFKLYKTKILNTMVTMFIIGASLVYLGRLVHSAIFNTQPPESTVSYGSTQLVGESRDLEKERNQPHKNRTGRFTRKIGFKAEAGKYAQQIVEIKIKNLTRNCNRTVFAMPIKDRTIMSFAHGWNHEPGDKIVLEIRYMNKVVEEPFYPALALYDDSRDIMFYSLMTNKIALFPNNLNKFLTDSEFDALGKTMAGYDHPKDGLLPGPCIKRENVEYLFGAGSTEKPSLQTLEECVLSNIPSSMGFCGLPLVILQGQHAGKIVGIHVAGSVGKTQAIVQSVTTPVTREYVLSALENLAAFESPTDNAEFVAEGQTCVTDNAMRCQYVEGQPKRPNIDWVEPVKKDDRIFVNRKTKLQPSIISDLLPPTWKTDKEPAVLSMHDHRSFPGLNEVQRSVRMDTDPILRQLADTGDVSIPDDVDLSLVREIADTMFMHYQQDLKWPIGRRVLSFDEALAGVPGQLASVNLNTSPGWPLVTLRGRSRGKRDFVTFDQEGQLIYTQEFKTLCDLYEDSMLRGEQPYQHKFLGFLKDELVRKEKIENARTRIIYCNDFVATTVYRKYLGALLCAFQSSYETTASAVGINQFSFDMDNVYEWLTFERTRKVNFQAGDYKDFDKRHVKIIREYCYDIIRRLNGNIMPEQAWNIFYRNETKSPAQMGDILVKFKSNHYSGNFFTTVLNNLVNEFYHRYVFKRHYPNLIFDDWIRIKVYGDDHILGIDKSLVYTGSMIQKGMMELGQVYTSDKKGQEIVDYQNFEDVTFLGAQMRYLDQYQKWTGAIKLDIIHQTLMWTRDNDRSIEQTVDQMLAYLSQHDRTTFELYTDIIIKAMEKAGYDVRLKVGYSELQRIVATRSVGEDYRFYGILEKSNIIRNPIVPVRYVAEVQPWEPGWNGAGSNPWADDEEIEAPSITENPSGDSLTTFHDVVESTTVAAKGTTGHLSLKVAAKHGGDFGTESAMYRTNVEWNNTQVANHTLASWLAPKDFLALGEPNNVQNIGFQNYIYWEGEIEVIVQVSGTQWQQGLAMLYFQPLSTDVLAPYAALAMALPHVLLSPCDNSSKSLRVPFRFPRSVLNSYSMLDLSEEQENLGRFFLQVISPLQSIDNLTSTITIYTRFPNSKFTIPRPLSTTRTRQFHARHKAGTLRYPHIADIDGKSISSSSSISYIAEGNTYSQNSTSTTYDIHDVVGGVPIENSGGGVSASAKGGNDISASAEVVPMDNPPLVGGTFPISGQFGSMSKVTGPELTVGADLHRERMCRQHKSLFDQEELKIAWLASRWSTIVKDTSLNYPGIGDWAVGDDENTILYELPLTSVFMTIGDTDLSLGKSLGHINQAFINMFTFWRADIEFKISIVGTPFHAGKLRATIGYGAPVGASGSHQNIFYNQIFTFDGSNSVRSFVIPYNAATQFLYTYMGPSVQNPVQDFSLGTLTISVANRLKAPESVMQKVNVLLSFRYHNVRVAVPRVVWPYSGIPTGEGETPEASVTGFIVKPAPTTLKKKVEKKKTTFVAESNPSEPTVGLTENKLDDKAVDGVAEVTEVEVDIPAGRPCRLHLGAKFEYLVTNVIDVFRRGRGGAGIMWNTETQQIQPFDLSGPPVDRVAYFIENKPHSILNLFFAAWAGTLRYRIHNFTDGNISNPSVPPRIAYFPAPPYVPAPGGAPDAYVTLALGDGSLVTYPDGMSIRNGAAQLTVGVGNQNIATMNSVELLYPTANGQSWIDYSVPFDSIFDYAVSSMKRGTGIIVVGPLPKETSESTNQPSCWQMFGDDFEFGVFRVPIQLYYTPFYHTSAAVAINKTAPQAYY